MTGTAEREELERDIIATYESADELGQALYHLAIMAVSRGDRQKTRDLFALDRMERRSGEGVDLNACEALGALSQRVKGKELRQWARAVSACMDLGSADILFGIDALARRRVCH
ncbi:MULTISPECIES: hypothetical protein [unclassified Sulfitobacter]|uniref:hypothetical protein n=1 Tax=unclassified Sulfitobacter TaxID=196795 RepID=UPI0037452647